MGIDANELRGWVQGVGIDRTTIKKEGVQQVGISGLPPTFLNLNSAAHSRGGSQDSSHPVPANC